MMGSSLGGMGMGTWITLIVALPFLLIALFLWSRAKAGTREAREARQWPTVTGEVITSDVRASTSTDSNGSHNTAYYPDVVFAYRVGRQDYRGYRIAPGPEVGSGIRSQAAQMAARYPAGARVTVHYDPAAPDHAFLELEARASGVLKWVAGCMTAFVLVVLLAMWLIGRAVEGAVGKLL